MEVIRIPQVSLVDATGRRIGVYTDDPDWWQQLKLKHHNSKMSHAAMLPSHQPPAITSGAATNAVGSTVELPLTPSRQMTPINNINTDSNTNLRSRLIRDVTDAGEEEVIDAERAMQTGLTPAVAQLASSTEEVQKQCNVIGETPLHIAIMYDDLHTIQFLIEEKGFDVNQRSSGGKFIGGFNSKLTSSMIQQSKYEGLAYYGEYPLAFAACFASKEIYDYLVEKGADPNLKDTNGNTVLHVLVINNKIDMFQYATNHQKRKALLTIKNNQDLTPINLAAKLGRKDLFEKMLELRNIEFWRYSNITCSAYPLEGLDTVDPDGKIAWNAALSYIVNGKTEDHLDMLEIGVVKRLLEDKWSTYAQKRFFQKLVISIIHLIFLSIAVYTRAADTANLAQWPPGSANTWVRYISEAAVLLGCLAILFLNAQEIYAQGFLYYVKNLGGEPANVFYIIFCIFILIAVPFRFVYFDDKETKITNRNVEDTFVILAIPCGWVHLLFYARVATVTGPFVVMIYKMVIGDILTFSSIYSLLLFGFSSAFYYLYKNAGSDVVAMANYPEALMLTFQMTLGEFKERLGEFDENYYSDFTKVIFVGFMILMHILLLNMLIAMMGNTYHQIIKKSEKEWRRQWAQVVILLERSFSPQDLKNYQLKYCIKLPSKDSNNKNELGLMVIKKAPKTKAFQKTTCIRNWKKFCKTVMHILKEENLKSYELLEHWANKDIQKAKAKKSKKSLDWNTLETKTHNDAGKELLERSFNQRQLTSAKFNAKNARENSIIKKPLPVEQQPPKPAQQKAVDSKPQPKQKESINSISSSVSSSANNTMTTTGSETASSRGSSANNGQGSASQTSETPKKNSVRGVEKGVDKKNNQVAPQAPPPPPPATTINPPAKTDFNPVPKKNPYTSNNANDTIKPENQSQTSSNPDPVKTSSNPNTKSNDSVTHQPIQPSVVTIVPGVARPLITNEKNSDEKIERNKAVAAKQASNESTNDVVVAAVKPTVIPSHEDNDDNKNRDTSKEKSKSDASKKDVRPIEAYNDVGYVDQNKPLITPESSNPSTETTSSPVGSAHYQPLKPDLQKIQLNRYIHKKTFYPNRTSKIYSSPGSAGNSDGGRGLFSPDYYENFPKQINISPVHGDYPKMDLSDISRRPFSSQLSNLDLYMKRDEYPKFTHASGGLNFNNSHQSGSKSPDEILSLDDGSSGSSLFKSTRRNSHEDDQNEQNESKI